MVATVVLSACTAVERPAWRRVRDRIADIRAAGEPTTFEALRADGTSPDGADAAPEYRMAAAVLDDLQGRAVFDLVRTYRDGARRCPPIPPGDDVRKRARRLLAGSEQALAAIDRAAGTSVCHFAYNLESDPFGIPAVPPFRVAAGLVSLRTLDVAGDDPDRAAASLVSALRMLRVFETEPVILSYLVRLVAWGQAAADLPAVLAGGRLSDASLDALDAALARAEAPDLLKRTMEGERIWEMRGLAAVLGPDWPDAALRPARGERRPFWERPALLRRAGD